MTDSHLNINNLCVNYPGSRVVNNISFTLGSKRLALVGKSGSDESMTTRALIGLVCKPGVVTAGALNVLGHDAPILNTREWQQLRSNGIVVVLRNLRYTLNPVKTVKAQLEEALTLHQRLNRHEKKEKINTAVQAVGLNTRVLQSYPRELSGGIGQRVMITIAPINDSRILIADKPTSALDMHLYNQILELLVTQYEQRQVAVLLISHDLPLIAQSCHWVLMVYQGNRMDEMYAAALPTATHPYTHTLWTCRPSVQTYG